VPIRDGWATLCQYKTRLGVSYHSSLPDPSPTSFPARPGQASPRTASEAIPLLSFRYHSEKVSRAIVMVQ
jgi:hypothetical protein